jgi:two-component system NtrC family sensor kinase
MSRGSNTRFFVPPEEKTHLMPEGLVSPNPQTVLIVEDDPVLANMLKDLLQPRNFLVAQVTGGAEGVQKIMAADFDVILCDMVMPGFPGDMFYRAVERARPHLCKRFIFMTGHTGDMKIDAFIREVRGLMLWKPFQVHEVLEAIEMVTRKTSSSGGRVDTRTG